MLFLSFFLYGVQGQALDWEANRRPCSGVPRVMTGRIFRLSENTGRSLAKSVILTEFLKGRPQHVKSVTGNAGRTTVMNSGWALIVQIVTSLSHGNTWRRINGIMKRRLGILCKVYTGRWIVSNVMGRGVLLGLRLTASGVMRMITVSQIIPITLPQGF